MRFPFLVAGTLAVSLACGLVHGQTVVIEPTRDGTLYQDPAGLLANGSGSSLFAGLNNMLGARRGLVRFDVAAAVPSGSVICTAVLRLDSIAGGTNAIPVAVHRVTADWGEGASIAGGAQGGGGTSAAGDATWIHTFYPSALWATAGGDYVASSSATTTVAGFATWSWTGLAADVQFMLDQPASNFGWILKSPETLAGTVKNFASRESTTSSVRPRLEITYLAPVAAVALDAGGGCPASTFMIGAVGAPVLGSATFAVTFAGGPPNGTALLYLSTGLAATPTVIAGGCVVVLDLAGVASYVAGGTSPIAPLPLDAAGALLLPAGVPADPCLVGFQVAVQAGALDPAIASFFTVSNGVLLTLGF